VRLNATAPVWPNTFSKDLAHYCGCRAWTFYRFTNNDAAVSNIERQRHEICNSGHGHLLNHTSPYGRAAQVQTCRAHTRLTNGFSKKLDNHVAAVALYVAHYNLCRVHEALKTTPAKALGVVDRTWAIGELIDAALATQPITPPTAPERRKRFTVIDGGRK